MKERQSIQLTLIGSCSDMIQPIISSASSSKEAWERLLHSYANASRSRIISLKYKLAKNPKGNKSVAEFLNENVTYAYYGGPDEIFLGDGKSHPISYTGWSVPIKKLNIQCKAGVKSKELLIWVGISDIFVSDHNNGKITFGTSSGLSRTFPVSAFQ
ncbi:putative zinc finger, CCHC-type containing protein [Tanacetum coccineum]